MDLEDLFGTALAASSNPRTAAPGISETQLGQASRGVEQLEARLNTLTLACQAMWELLSETCGISSEDLQQRMREVDLRDGKRDGKLAPAAMIAGPRASSRCRPAGCAATTAAPNCRCSRRFLAEQARRDDPPWIARCKQNRHARRPTRTGTAIALAALCAMGGSATLRLDAGDAGLEAAR